MMSKREVVICNPVRTPIGAFGGSLKEVPATELGAVAVRETLRRSDLDPAALASVVMGNVIQAGNKMNPARQASIGGGVPVAVPALTVNRVCGSGAQAIACEAQARGDFDAELVAVEIPGRKGPQHFTSDEQPSPDTTVETLARLRPAFRPDGTITAGNAPGLNSGAAAMLVAERGFAEARGIEPFARLVAYGVAAVEPRMFGLGPGPAVQIALERAGWEIANIEPVQIHE